MAVMKSGIWLLSDDEYQQLKSDIGFLECLQVVGVDNWEGYSTAWQLFEGEISEDDI